MVLAYQNPGTPLVVRRIGPDWRTRLMQCYEMIILLRSLRADALTLFPEVVVDDLALDTALCDFGIECFADYVRLSRDARHRLAWHACELMATGAGPDLPRAA